MARKDILIIVAGVCGSGKSTLVRGLQKLGYPAHAVAQEHSYSPTMYTMTHPNFIIVLDSKPETIKKRRQVSHPLHYLEEQRERLRHIREHCHLFIETDDLSPDRVLEKAVAAIESYSRPREGDTKIING